MKTIVLFKIVNAIDRRRLAMLRRSGYEVTVNAGDGPASMRPVTERPPDAFVIDLERRPAQGRAVAVWLRRRKATKRVPIIFAGGADDAVDAARTLLPDAYFTGWNRIRGTLRTAVSATRGEPVVPGTMDDYAGRPLAAKLGITGTRTVALIGAPPGFEETLGDVPAGVKLRRRSGARADIVLLFAGSRALLNRRFPAAVRGLAQGGRLWIIWPKKASGVDSDLSQRMVREFGLGGGFVDYKISAIDETWSGLCFARRDGKEERTR
jgi:hypothetical protein